MENLEDQNTKQDEVSVTEKNPNDFRPSYIKKRVIIPSILAVVFIIMGVYFVIQSLFYQKTDDAFVEGHIVSIAPRVSGPVVDMLIDDNKPVKKGDLLIVIDKKPYEVRLQQSKAKLSEAKATLNVANKEISKSQALIEDAKLSVVSNDSKLDFASKDFNRYSDMYTEGISSKQEYDSSKTKLTVATQNKKQAIQKQKSATATYEAAVAKKEATLAEIQKLEAQVKEDTLNLSYTEIYAPQDGLITSRSVEKGNYLQVGQPMFSIVPEKIWIVANFKETQLTNMEIGQDVVIKIDTYPSKRFKGRVDSIQRATGAKASLFPPENAVGSYVKIVQRVPVKITFEEDISKYNIVPGMSVVPAVKIK